MTVKVGMLVSCSLSKHEVGRRMSPRPNRNLMCFLSGSLFR